MLSDLVKDVGVPVVVGNTVSYSVTKELMEEGVHGILVGVGPGSACTSREVLGIGVPQVTATMECVAARNDYFNETGRYVSIVTDGGLRTGGDVCKSVACGADAVMIGSPFAKTEEGAGEGDALGDGDVARFSASGHADRSWSQVHAGRVAVWSVVDI